MLTIEDLIDKYGIKNLVFHHKLSNHIFKIRSISFKKNTVKVYAGEGFNRTFTVSTFNILINSRWFPYYLSEENGKDYYNRIYLN